MHRGYLDKDLTEEEIDEIDKVKVSLGGVAASGHDPCTIEALVKLCEVLGLPVFHSASRAYHCFPMTHSLFQRTGTGSAKDLLANPKVCRLRLLMDGPYESAS